MKFFMPIVKWESSQHHNNILEKNGFSTAVVSAILRTFVSKGSVRNFAHICFWVITDDKRDRP